MLITCPECELPVSDKALSCPHCGYPLKKDSVVRPSTKRKRLPNGFGQISEIKNANLRNRFRAMVTVGKTSTGKYIVKPLKPVSFFHTYNEAYAALVEYNKDPYSLDDEMTVKELYEKWSEEYRKSLKSDSSFRTITSAWAYCSDVYDIRARDLRARHIKDCMENGKYNNKTPSANIKSRIKSMFNLMLDYALEYELVTRNYARTFVLSGDIIDEKEQNTKGHISFTDEEMNVLWNHLTVPYVDVLLFQCYSGWRPQEIGLIEISNVNLEKGIMIGGMKTEAGKNRVVPIHPKIKEIVERNYKESILNGRKYLFTCTDGSDLTYDKYQKRFVKLRDDLRLNPEHRPHDGRKHFVTMAKKYKVDEYAIKYIIGHRIEDLTERVYTDRTIEWLITEMKKLK